MGIRQIQLTGGWSVRYLQTLYRHWTRNYYETNLSGYRRTSIPGSLDLLKYNALTPDQGHLLKVHFQRPTDKSAFRREFKWPIRGKIIFVLSNFRTEFCSEFNCDFHRPSDLAAIFEAGFKATIISHKPCSIFQQITFKSLCAVITRLLSITAREIVSVSSLYRKSCASFSEMEEVVFVHVSKAILSIETG